MNSTSSLSSFYSGRQGAAEFHFSKENQVKKLGKKDDFLPLTSLLSMKPYPLFESCRTWVDSYIAVFGYSVWIGSFTLGERVSEQIMSTSLKERSSGLTGECLMIFQRKAWG